MKVLFVLGTRPEAIKLAPLVLALRRESGVQSRVCATSQHREMLHQMMALFGLQPDDDLELMQANQDLIDLSCLALGKFRDLLDTARPDRVVVQGDTTSAFIAALAAAYRKIPVAHVEAGLRSFRKDNPFPEEINRVLADHVAQWCFAPTDTARQNLLNEGIASEKIHVTGNTIVDALHMVQKKMEEKESRSRWTAFFRERHGLDMERHKPLILATTHRRESFGKDLEAICRAFLQVASVLPREARLVLPVHPNPNVRETVSHLLSECPQIVLTPPLDYEALLFLMMRADLVMTDSGGIQEEAPSFGVPVVVMRKTTERPELIAAGFGEMAGTNADAIVAAALRWLGRKPDLAGKPNPFGDGQASKKIVEVLLRG